MSTLLATHGISAISRVTFEKVMYEAIYSKPESIDHQTTAQFVTNSAAIFAHINEDISLAISNDVSDDILAPLSLPATDESSGADIIVEPATSVPELETHQPTACAIAAVPPYRTHNQHKRILRKLRVAQTRQNNAHDYAIMDSYIDKSVNAQDNLQSIGDLVMLDIHTKVVRQAKRVLRHSSSPCGSTRYHTALKAHSYPDVLISHPDQLSCQLVRHIRRTYEACVWHNARVKRAWIILMLSITPLLCNGCILPILAELRAYSSSTDPGAVRR
jgi:hypothetical protein